MHATELLGRHRDEPQRQREHHGDVVGGNAQTLERPQEEAQRIGQLGGSRRVRDRKAAHHQQHDTHREEKAAGEP